MPLLRLEKLTEPEEGDNGPVYYDKVVMETVQAASDTASVNKGVMYSEGSLQQLMSSIDRSKIDESFSKQNKLEAVLL